MKEKVDSILGRLVNILCLFEEIKQKYKDVRMIKPLGDKVLLKLIIQEAKSGSLFLSAPDKSMPLMASVLAHGPGLFEHGQLRPLEVKVGDLVLVPPYIGTTVPSESLEGELIIVHEKQILGIFQ